jgi:hypothetical protein
MVPGKQFGEGRGIAMMDKMKSEYDDFVLVDGWVVEESAKGESVPVEGVLVKSSSGTFTYTNQEGYFSCPVCSTGSCYAICAVKSGYQVWVDWAPMSPQECRSGLVIPLKLGPEGTECQLIKQVSGPGCCMGKVIDSVTKKGIYKASVTLEGNGPPSLTNKNGVFPCKCAPAGDRQLCVTATNYQSKCITVRLPLGQTVRDVIIEL